MVVRLSFIKFKESGQTDSFSDAVRMILEHITPFCKGALFDHQNYRDKYLWKERPDMTLKKYKPIMDAFFAKYSGAKAKPGQKAFMSLDEFKSLADEGGLLESDSKLAERDISVCYASSMMTQIDELNKGRIMEMSFVEFLEGFARLADKAAIIPISVPEEQKNQVNDKWRQNDYPLWAKIEAAIARASCVFPFAQKKRMPIPTTPYYEDLQIKYD